MKSSPWTSLCIFLALFAASVEPVIVKIGYKGALGPLDLLVYKHLVAAVVILPMTRAFFWIGWARLRQVLVVSVLLLVTNGLVLVALRSLSATTLVTLITTTPAFVALVNRARGRDILGPRFWLGFGLCLAGVALSVGSFQAESHVVEWTGVLAIAGAIASSTVYRTRMEDVTRALPSRTASTYIFLIDGLLCAVVLLPFTTTPTAGELVVCGWIGLAAAIANIAFLAAISVVGSTRMSIFDMLQRPLVIVMAAVFLKEPLTPEVVAGAVLVMAGVYLARVKRVVMAKSVVTEA